MALSSQYAWLQWCINLPVTAGEKSKINLRIDWLVISYVSGYSRDIITAGTLINICVTENSLFRRNSELKFSLTSYKDMQLVECETTSNWLWMRNVGVKPWQLKICFGQHALWYNGVVDSLLHTDISAFNSELGTRTYGRLCERNLPLWHHQREVTTDL